MSESIGIKGVGEFVWGYVDNQFTAYVSNTPEQIAAFIMENQYASTKITNFLDELEIETTFGSFIMYCRDQTFLQQELLPVLVPMQRGEAEIIEFVPVESE